MLWSDELVLYHAEDIPNENGFTELVVDENSKTIVYANKKSVGYGEFFAAKMAGFNEEIKFDVFTVEYDDQKVAEFKGKRYMILRTYIDPKTNGEYTELTLSDTIKQRRR